MRRIHAWPRSSGSFGLGINVFKTKAKRIKARNEKPITTQGQILEKIVPLPYIGRVMATDEGADMVRRIRKTKGKK